MGPVAGVGGLPSGGAYAVWGIGLTTPVVWGCGVATEPTAGA